MMTILMMMTMMMLMMTMMLMMMIMMMMMTIMMRMMKNKNGHNSAYFQVRISTFCMTIDLNNIY